jgi:AcrR family transcriptional regulator
MIGAELRFKAINGVAERRGHDSGVCDNHIEGIALRQQLVGAGTCTLQIGKIKPYQFEAPTISRNFLAHFCSCAFGLGQVPRLGVNISLDDVNAKQVGIGPGTLYRHFPTRDALLEAVYRAEVEKLAAAERKFTETMTQIEALRAWMLLFVDYIATKQIIAPALNTIVGGPSELFAATTSQTTGAINGLVERAIKSRDIRPDLDPLDLLRALVGVSNVASAPDWAQSAKRLVEILLLDSRPIK